jgi:hypothetical protein
LETKIFPSPIFPVRAALTIESMAPSTASVGNDDLDLHLGEEIDHIFGSPIQFGVPLLTTKALDFRDGQAGNADVRQALRAPRRV